MNIISLAKIIDHSGNMHYEVLGDVSNNPKWFFNYEKAYKLARRASSFYKCQLIISV